MIQRIERFQTAIRYSLALQNHMYNVPKKMLSEDALEPRRSCRILIPFGYAAHLLDRRRRFNFAPLLRNFTTSQMLGMAESVTNTSRARRLNCNQRWVGREVFIAPRITLPTPGGKCKPGAWRNPAIASAIIAARAAERQDVNNRGFRCATSPVIQMMPLRGGVSAE